MPARLIKSKSLAQLLENDSFMTVLEQVQLQSGKYEAGEDTFQMRRYLSWGKIKVYLAAAEGFDMQS